MVHIPTSIPLFVLLSNPIHTPREVVLSGWLDFTI
jgi:hypothetical protein